jgi:uncharacterized protein (DUF1778 family)
MVEGIITVVNLIFLMWPTLIIPMVIIDMYGVIPYTLQRRRLTMFAIEIATPTPGKMEARKEVRMHRADEERIKAAAAATGLQEADFIRQAALLRAQEVEQRISLSILPIDAFEAFKAAVALPGKAVPGLARAAEASKGLLKDAD